jgi:GT2 family glycosyltransferase
MRVQIKEPLVSIVILNFNTKNFLVPCLSSVLNSSYPNFEVILVDNGSKDGSVDLINEKFGDDPRLRIIINNKNLGYAEGNNIGAKHAKGKYVVFLNPDTYVVSSWLNELVRIMEADSTIGAAQCKLLLMRNPRYIDNVGHYIDFFGKAHMIGHHEEDLGQYNEIFEILGATGAAFAIRRGLFEELGGFDSDFFMIFEETDLCWRVWLRGYRVVYVPAAVVFHYGRGSFNLNDPKVVCFTTYLFVRNRIMSLIKNYSTRKLIMFLPLHLLFLGGFAIAEAIRKKPRITLAVISAVSWNVVNLSTTIRKRMLVQKSRVVTDDFLIKDKKLIKEINISVILSEVKPIAHKIS